MVCNSCVSACQRQVFYHNFFIPFSFIVVYLRHPWASLRLCRPAINECPKRICTLLRVFHHRFLREMNTLVAAVILTIARDGARAWMPPHPRPSLHVPTSSSSRALSPPPAWNFVVLRRKLRRQRLVGTPRIDAALRATRDGDTSSHDDRLAPLLVDVDDASLPILRIESRIGSGTYGTVHHARLVRSNDDVRSCVAKRAWTRSECLAGVPDFASRASEKAVAVRTGLARTKQILGTNDGEDAISEEEAERRAERCKHYWEVERHCFQKLQQIRSLEKNGEMGLLKTAVPSFWGVYYDDGSGSTTTSESIPGYGLKDEEQKRNSIGSWFSSNGDNGTGDETSSAGHPWMVFECIEFPTTEDRGQICALTLLDAMEVSIRQHTYNHLPNH